MKKILNAFVIFSKTLVRNKYITTVVLFVIWVTFVDTHSLVDRVKELKKLNSLKKDVETYKEDIVVLKAKHYELFSDNEDLEKFAREEYLMKEPDEDIVVVLD